MAELDMGQIWREVIDGAEIVDWFDLDGRRYLRVRPRAAPPSVPPAKVLSEREEQVLERVARGEANKVIAFDLGVSESTVSVYVRRASAKIGATSRVGLVQAYAQRAAVQARAA